MQRNPDQPDQPYWGKIDATAALIDNLRETPIRYRELYLIANAMPRATKRKLEFLESGQNDSPLPETEEDNDFGLADGRIPLSFHEERELLRYYHQGEDPEADPVDKITAKEAEEKLLQAHMPVIVSIAKKVAKNPADIGDLINEGCIKFLELLKISPVRLASRFIRRYFSDLYYAMASVSNKLSGTIYVPYHVARWQDSYDKLLEEGSSTEAAIKKIWDKERVRRPHFTGDFVSRALKNSALSEIDHPGTRILNEVPDQENDLDEEIRAWDIKRHVRAKLETMKPRTRRVLEERFGPDERTLEDVGNYYDLTRERIRQIEAAIIKKLKKTMRPTFKDLL